jgi:site-specific DNA-methyltransferase (adenine-specific)
MSNALYYGDNLSVLREQFDRESVDLIYLDPPFNSSANYNVLFKAPDGAQSDAQLEAFKDTWHWTDEAEEAFDQVMKSGHADTAEMLRAMRSFLRENDMMAYLAMMCIRLIELHRVLKSTGSLYLHCDPTASHYLKILLDSVFGKENFQNEIIWKRTSSHNNAKRWAPVHDTLFFYSKTKNYLWKKTFTEFDEEYLKQAYKHKDDKGYFKTSDLTGAGLRRGDSGMPWKEVDPTSKKRHWAVPREILFQLGIQETNLTTQEKLDLLEKNGYIFWPEKGSVPLYKKYLDFASGLPVSDVIADISPLSSQSKERLGYPTQKPLALLERIIQASSEEGDVVLDPFCGCGTAVHAAEKLNRRWKGIDITHLSISLIEKRLRDAFPGIGFEVHGTPKDMGGAWALAERDKYQFQWWAVSLVDAVPYGGKKKGADGGVDGHIYFKPDGKTTEKAIVSVKGGSNVSVTMIRDLGHVIEREKAKIGVFITLVRPTDPMVKESLKAGYYETPFGKFPRIQILTIQELFDGKKPQIPARTSDSFRRAALEVRETQEGWEF